MQRKTTHLFLYLCFHYMSKANGEVGTPQRKVCHSFVFNWYFWFITLNFWFPELLERDKYKVYSVRVYWACWYNETRQSPQRNKCCFKWEKVVLCDVVSKQKKLSKHLFSPLSHSQPGSLAVLSHFSQHNFGWQQTHITLQNALSSFFQLCKIYSPAVLSDSIFLPNPNSPSASLLCGFAGSFPRLTGSMQMLVR